MSGTAYSFAEGDLVIQGVGKTRQKLADAAPAVLDFSGVGRMDAAGLQLILSFLKSHPAVKITNLPASLQELATLAGWDWKSHAA